MRGIFMSKRLALETSVLLATMVVALTAHAAEEVKAKPQPHQASLPAAPKQAGRAGLKTRPSGDAAIIHTVADAMGFVRGMGRGETTKSINRVQWRGTGSMLDGGVTYPVTSYIYTVSLSLEGTREDITRTAKGKPQRLVRVALDSQAWDEREPGIDELPASDTALNRRLQLARSPIGFTRALLDADPATVKITDPGPAGKVSIAFAIDGVPIKATLNADYRPETITTTVEGKEIVDRHTNYQDLSEYGLMFATRWTETVAGKPYLTMQIDDGRVASYAVFPKPISSAHAAN